MRVLGKLFGHLFLTRLVAGEEKPLADLTAENLPLFARGGKKVATLTANKAKLELSKSTMAEQLLKKLDTCGNRGSEST